MHVARWHIHRASRPSASMRTAYYNSPLPSRRTRGTRCGAGRGCTTEADHHLHHPVAQSHRAAVMTRRQAQPARRPHPPRRPPRGGLGGTQPRCARESGACLGGGGVLPRRRRRLGRVEPAAGSGCRRRRAAPRGRAASPAAARYSGRGAHACLSPRARLTGGCAPRSPPVFRGAPRARASPRPRGGDGRVGFVPAENQPVDRGGRGRPRSRRRTARRRRRRHGR